MNIPSVLPGHGDSEAPEVSPSRGSGRERRDDASPFASLFAQVQTATVTPKSARSAASGGEGDESASSGGSTVSGVGPVGEGDTSSGPAGSAVSASRESATPANGTPGAPVASGTEAENSGSGVQTPTAQGASTPSKVVSAANQADSKVESKAVVIPVSEKALAPQTAVSLAVAAQGPVAGVSTENLALVLESNVLTVVHPAKDTQAAGASAAVKHSAPVGSGGNSESAKVAEGTTPARTASAATSETTPGSSSGGSAAAATGTLDSVVRAAETPRADGKALAVAVAAKAEPGVVASQGSVSTTAAMALNTTMKGLTSATVSPSAATVSLNAAAASPSAAAVAQASATMPPPAVVVEAAGAAESAAKKGTVNATPSGDVSQAVPSNTSVNDAGNAVVALSTAAKPPEPMTGTAPISAKAIGVVTAPPEKLAVKVATEGPVSVDGSNIAEVHLPSIGVTPVELGPVVQGGAGAGGGFPTLSDPTLASLNDYVVKSVRYLVSNGEKTFTLRLVPPSLGEVRLEVTSQGNSVSVRMMSANPVVREALQSQIHGLHAALLRDGITVTQATVSAQMSFDHSAAGFSGGQASGHPQNAVSWSERASPTIPSGEITAPPQRAAAHSGVLNLFV